MRAIERLILVSISVLLIVSCATNPSEDHNAVEQASLDAWIAKYEPTATRDGDMYYHLTPGGVPNARPVLDGDWVRVEIVGRDMAGGIFYNTNDTIFAHKIGSFTKKTRYSPKKALMANNYASGFTTGQLDMLLKMKEGDSCRVYLPSRLAYKDAGTSITNGYQGNVQIKGGQPVVFDMKIVELIKQDINGYEQDQVKQKALELGIDLADTLRSDLIYLKPITILAGKPGDNTGELITIDSAFYYYFSIRFLDEFLISTNVDSVSKQAWNTSNAVSSIPMLFDKSSSTVPKVMLQAAEYGKIRYGQVFRLAYTSRYGYGAAGYPASTENISVPYTIIEPYTPLTMDVYIVPKIYE